MSDANKQKGMPESTLLLLSVSSMQAGVQEGAGRWGGSGGLKVSKKDKEEEEEEEEESAASTVEEVVAEERVAPAAVVAPTLAPVDTSLAALPVPVPVLLSLFFFFPLEISTTLNLHMT